MRFPEFSGEWEKTKLSEVCHIATGNKNTQDKDDNGQYPFYVRSQHIEHINSWTYDGEAILTAGDGVGVGKVFHYSKGKIGVHQRVYILNDFKCDGKFLFYYFSGHFYDRVKRMSAKNSVDSVRMEMIANMNFIYPRRGEQTKIGHLFSLLDERIETQIRIIEDLKSERKFLLEQLFCLPKEHTPKLRLKGMTGDWYKVRLYDIVERITERNKANTCSRVLTIAAQYGLIDQQEFFNKQIASSDLTNYYLLHKGDFAYNKSYSGDYPWGAVKRLDNYNEGVLSSLYVCFRPNGSVDSDFLCHYFESTKWYRGISEISGEGARNHGLLNMSVDDYFNTIHRIPSLEEQRQISTMLNTIVQKIKIEESIIDKLQKQKSYLLKEMFV